MRKGKLFLVILSCIVLSASFLFAGGEKEQAKTKTEEKTLIVGVPTLINSMDYEKPTLTGCQITTLMRDIALHWKRVPYPYDEGLKNEGVMYPSFDEVEFAMFESYEISPDGRITTFHIKPGIVSKYGNEFTSADVQYTLERGFELNGFIKWLFGNAGLNSIDNVKVVDKYTFQFVVDEPTPLAALIHCNTWSAYIDSTEAKKHATDDDPWSNLWLDRNDCGYGPYSLEEWKAGEYMRFKAREDFREGKPFIDTILFREIPESANRVALIEKGSIDMALNLAPKELEYLKDKPGVKIYNIFTANYTYIIMNEKIKPFDDVRVRQAMNFACPREEIARDVYRGFATPMTSVIPRNRPGWSDKYWIYSYNLNKAKSLITEAGYPNGFEVELAYDNANPMDEAIAIAFKSSLEKIGVTVNLRAMIVSQLAEMKAKKVLPLAIETGLPVQPDVNYSLTIFYKPFAPLNFGNYENQQVLEWMNEGATIIDLQERNQFHQKIQKALVEDPPVIPVIETNLQVALRDNIHGNLIVETCNDFYWHKLKKD